MPTSRIPYTFPVRTVREAKAVIEPEFQPNLFDEQELYVNLDEIRDRSYLDKLYFALGYDRETESFESPAGCVKIIFSGHRGCGKSTELRRIYSTLNAPGRYFTVFIDLEQEVEVGSFQYADFFSLLIHKLIEGTARNKVKGGAGRLQALAEKLLGEKTEKTRSKKKKRSTEVEAGAEGGFKLFGFGGKASFKEVFSGENEISTTVRQEIKQNTLQLINELNVEMGDTRLNIQESGQGEDILFIIDGSEKIQSDVYEELFIKKANILSELDINMLMAVPISSYYQIEKAPNNFSTLYTVPMIKLEKNDLALELMKKIIGKRIEIPLFIEGDAMNTCIEYSGGCIRQLFQVVHTSLISSLGKKIEMTHVKEAIYERGKYLWEYLDNEHMKVLSEENYRPAERKVGELLYILILLKYNGKIKVNPLLASYPDFLEWKSKDK
ncbi:hypothetical protein [Puia sp.]|uniref:hypothetical protein n=1 Tax=Puia sp. TaxID=2045100 RepID=UPI002F3EDABA